jgi:hypothetical protein
VAICIILEDPSQTREQADRIVAHVRSTGSLLPEGARLLLSGHANPGWRVITVWDSEAARDQFFAERLTAAYEAAGLSMDNVARTKFEVQMLIAGDLVGAPQRSPGGLTRGPTPAWKP